MKSILASILVFALVGSAMCARLRRQVPAAASQKGGAPEGLKTPDSPMGLEGGKDTMAGDLQNQQSFGVPVNADAVGQVAKPGGDWKAASSISNPDKSNVDQLKTAPKLAEDAASAGGGPPA